MGDEGRRSSSTERAARGALGIKQRSDRECLSSSGSCLVVCAIASSSVLRRGTQPSPSCSKGSTGSIHQASRRNAAKSQRIVAHRYMSTNHGQRTLAVQSPPCADWTIDRIRQHAALIGQAAAARCELFLDRRPHPERSFRACRISRLARVLGWHPPPQSKRSDCALPAAADSTDYGAQHELGTAGQARAGRSAIIVEAFVDVRHRATAGLTLDGIEEIWQSRAPLASVTGAELTEFGSALDFDPAAALGRMAKPAKR